MEEIANYRTDDYGILEEMVVFAEGIEKFSVFEHITRAVNWLLKDRDERGLIILIRVTGVTR